ncbi:hypothetical protein LINGRAHAP2_LOCUS5148 [Linum grandiflorum]
MTGQNSWITSILTSLRTSVSETSVTGAFRRPIIEEVQDHGLDTLRSKWRKLVCCLLVVNYGSSFTNCQMVNTRPQRAG